MPDTTIKKPNDKTTIRNLIKEAQGTLRAHTKDFERTDSHESMEAMYTWGIVLNWLKEKINR